MLLSLLVANLKMMVRDRQTLFWALTFPLIFVVVFGLVDFDISGSADIAIFDHAHSDLSRSITNELEGLEFLDVDSSYSTEEEARNALVHGDLGYVLVIPQGLGEAAGTTSTQVSLLYDAAEIKNNQLVLGVLQHLVDQVNLGQSPVPPLVEIAPQPLQARQVDYFDEVLVGLLGMGIMVHSIIALAVKVSSYRNQAIFKRILATPLPVRNYFVAEIVAHLLLALVQTAVILAAGIWIFGADLGSGVWLVFPIAALANIVFLNLGFIISGWSNSGSAASGMGNAITLPMMFLSGTFFATSTLPSVLPDIVRFLPLTPMLDAMRDVSIDGASLWSTWPELAILGGWILATAAAAVKVFRFG